MKNQLQEILSVVVITALFNGSELWGQIKRNSKKVCSYRKYNSII